MNNRVVLQLLTLLRSWAILFLVPIGGTLSPRAVNGQCVPRVFSDLPNVGTDGRVQAMHLFDRDGPGPASPSVMFGGAFHDGVTTSWSVTEWDGTRLYRVGPSGRACTDFLTFDLDGPGPNPARLIAAFTSSSLFPCLLSYDGGAWTVLGAQPFGHRALHLASCDLDGAGPLGPSLFAGGDFTVPSSGSRIKRWTGTFWDDVGFGSNAFTRAPDGLESFDLDGDGPESMSLVASGTTGPAPQRNGVFRWNGQSWLTLGQEFPQANTPICVVDPDGDGAATGALYARRIISSQQDSIVRWNGAGWDQVGSWLPNVESLQSVDLDAAGPLPAKLVVRAGGPGGPSHLLLEGNAWVPLAGTVTSKAALPIGVFDLDGHGNGEPVTLTSSTEPAGSLNGVARLNGSTLAPIGDGVLAADRNGDAPRDIAFVHPAAQGPLAGRLFATGSFTFVDGSACTGIAERVGVSWRPIGTGMTSSAPETRGEAIVAHDFDGPGPLPTMVVVGGLFSSINGTNLPSIGAFDGTQWHRLGLGVGGDIQRLHSYDADGSGPIAPALLAHRRTGGVFEFRDNTWTLLGALGTDLVRDVLSHDFDGHGPAESAPVIIPSAGSFEGAAVGVLAKWGASGWSAVPTPPEWTRVDWAVSVDFDGDGPLPSTLLVKPRLGGATSAPEQVYRWEDGSFVLHSEGLVPHTSPCVVDFDGSGPQLRNIVGSRVNPIDAVMFTGTTWQRIDSVAGGWNGDPIASEAVIRADLAGSPEEVHFVGAFTRASHQSASRHARVASLAPEVWIEPRSTSVPSGSGAIIRVRAAGSGTLLYQWRKNGVPLWDRTIGLRSSVAGSLTPDLAITGAAPWIEGEYSCVISGSCGSTTSASAVLEVTCLSSIGTTQDLFDYLALWSAQVGMTGLGLASDIDCDRRTTVQDLYDFLDAWLTGCN